MTITNPNWIAARVRKTIAGSYRLLCGRSEYNPPAAGSLKLLEWTTPDDVAETTLPDRGSRPFDCGDAFLSRLNVDQEGNKLGVIIESFPGEITYPFGNTTTLEPWLISCPNGGLACLAHNQSGVVNVNTAYRDPSGSWHTWYRELETTGIGSASVALAPIVGPDGNIWCLCMRDSLDQMGLLRLKPTATSLDFVDYNPAFVSRIPTGVPPTPPPDAFNGEFFQPTAWTDFVNRRVWFAYPGWQGVPVYVPGNPNVVANASEVVVISVGEAMDKRLEYTLPGKVRNYEPPVIVMGREVLENIWKPAQLDPFTVPNMASRQWLITAAIADIQLPTVNDLAWHEDGMIAARQKDGTMLFKNLVGAEPTPIPPDPQPPDPQPPEPGPGPGPGPGPMPQPLTVSVNSDKRSYTKNQTAVIGVICSQPIEVATGATGAADATITVTFKFKNNSPGPFTLKTDKDGVAFMSIAIKASYGKGNVLVGATAAKPGFTSAFATTTFRIT